MNCNRNSRSVNFPCEYGSSLKKTYTNYELLRTGFLRVLATDKEKILYRAYVLQDSHF